MIAATVASNLILLGVGGLFLAGVVYGFFTRSGSDIWSRPINSQDAPGAEGPGEASGRDEGEHEPMSQGTDATAPHA
jgi:hypothetical protein